MSIHPLKQTATWMPFHLDALGLVSLLGATEVDHALGKLTYNKITEFWPLLAAYTVSNNQISGHIPNSKLYNITDGLKAIDVSGWFSRWPMAREVPYSSSIVTVEYSPKTNSDYENLLAALIFGAAINASFIIFPILQGDSWAISHACATITTVIVRSGCLKILRHGVTSAAKSCIVHNEEVSDPTEPHRDPEMKSVLELPNGNRVRIKSTRDALSVLLSQPSLTARGEQVFSGLRRLGWVAFAMQAITLGSCNLTYQIMAVLSLLSGTLVACFGIGEEKDTVAGCVKLSMSTDERAGNREMFASMQLSEHEEDSLELWGLLPHRRNTVFWNRYQLTKADYATEHPVDVRRTTESPAQVVDQGNNVERPRTTPAVTPAPAHGSAHAPGTTSEPVPQSPATSYTSGRDLQAPRSSRLESLGAMENEVESEGVGAVNVDAAEGVHRRRSVRPANFDGDDDAASASASTEGRKAD